jgi:hypothetical protein
MMIISFLNMLLSKYWVSGSLEICSVGNIISPTFIQLQDVFEECQCTVTQIEIYLALLADDLSVLINIQLTWNTKNWFCCVSCRYVSGYKNRFQNFIRYLREMGDEVNNLSVRSCIKLLWISLIEPF